METRSRTIVSALAGSLALSLLCGAPSASLAKTPADQIVLGFSMLNILTMDPGAMNGAEMEYIANMYDYLIETDPTDKSKILPGLATSWTVSDDRQTLTFKLRDGIKFQSGNPLTAEDVVWSFRRILQLNLGQATFWKSFGFTADNVTQLVTAPDPLTVEIKLPAPTDPQLMLYNLTMGGAVAVDRKLVAQHEKDGDRGAAWLKTNSAGSGAFKLQNWQPNNTLVLERNADYWRGAPKMRRVIYRHLPESQAQRLAIERGDIDIAMTMNATDIGALKDNKNVQIESTVMGTVYYLGASMKDPKFADKRVRLALRHLVDYDGINNTLMPYYGIKHLRPIQKKAMGSLPDPDYKLDVPKAKQLLAEAGYPNGFKTTLRVLSDAPFPSVAAAMQSTMAQAGIDAQILMGNGEQVYGAMRKREFELIIGLGGGGSDPHPHSNLRSQIFNPDNSDEAKMSAFQGWRAAFHSPELNKDIETALLERDPEKQKSMYEDIQRKVEDVVPALQPFSQVVITNVVAKDVQGYRFHPGYTTRFRDVAKAR
ncbi:ABC transporter substrate-binding protein [Bosea sp. BK604]|uniref:ABC transporter substrate-binding protein n=1 Tax=Bosea sp. BK604 TaxID=2512180 RepID=UPI001045859F|nr:ABC transporter substrate-binding protein [Bosea sp. BK604]TCR65342.1 peptide/nickel transport system substrate-binding protein [Bosea sp. BK604]